MALTQVNSAGIADGAIVNADINNSAAVALSKLATSGTASSSNYLRGDGAWSAIDLSTKLNLTGGVMTGSLRLNDNLELQLGSSGSDLKLFHNGTDSYIHNSTGNLVLRGDFVQINNAANSEGMAWFSANGEVGLKYDNVEKFRTGSGGIEVTGGINLTTNLSLLDNGIAKFGTGDDLQLQHTGSYSKITNTTGDLVVSNTGDLYLQSNNTVLIGDVGANEYSAKFIDNGAVELYYDNSKKLDLYASGVNIYGDIDLPSGSVFIRDNEKLICGTGDDLQIYHNGSNRNLIESDGGSELHLNKDTSESMAKFKPDGAVELFYDNSKKIETASYGASVTGILGVNIASPTVGYGGDTGIHIHSSATTGSRGPTIHLTSGVSGTAASDGSKIHQSDTDLVIQNHENGGLFLGSGNAHRLTITSGGRCGIGTTSPNSQIHSYTTGSDGLLIQTSSYTSYVWQIESSGNLFNGSLAGELGIRGHSGIGFSANSGSSAQFRIESDGDLLGADTSIGSISDSRVKKNVVDYTYDLAKFKQLTPKTFDWINPEEHLKDINVRGFLAQDVKTIDDYWIKETDSVNQLDKELIGEGKALSSKLGSTDAMYVSVIKQLIAKIETLETKVAALESA